MAAMKLLVLLALVAPAAGMRMTINMGAERSATAANPIRKVVTMLTGMQKKVQDEGAKEEELYDRFMCYCKNGGADLQASIDAATTKIPQVSSDIKEAVEQLAQTRSDLKKAQGDRAAAEGAMAEAKAIRGKEAAAYAVERTDYETNIAAVKKAVSALEKGAGAAFLQTGAAELLKKLAMARDMGDADRTELLSFLTNSQSSEYAPASGEITGILKQMGDDMSKSLNDATAEENSSISSFGSLMSAKTKEVAALTASIEAKMTKVGELGVAIVTMKKDLSDTEEALAEDTKFLADMETQCAAKTAEWEVRAKTRAAEQQALAETIKILNDDDALELFKKTLPGAGSASFVQMAAGTAASARRRTLSLLDSIRHSAGANKAGIDFILIALRAKGSLKGQQGFEKVVKMVDDMVALLKKEQVDDDSQKEYCGASLDSADDKRKALDRSKSDEEGAIASAQEGIATLTEEMKALVAGISALDKSVAEATDNRKSEHEENNALLSSNAAAKELLNFAKNRLNKFYNPKLYKAPAKKELAAEDRIVENLSFLQVSKDAPAPPPETFGAYAGAKEENTGVIAMIDLLVADLDKEMQEAETEEKNAQSGYESMMQDSAEKRTMDSKSLTDKGAAKAALEGDLEAHKEEKKAVTRELLATLEYIQSLHAECDWLLQNYDARKEARVGEIDSLVKAKAILSGADM